MPVRRPTRCSLFLDYADVPIFLENRVLPAKPAVKFMDHVQGRGRWDDREMAAVAAE